MSTVTMENITPEKATAYLERNFDRNRKISPKKVKHYSREMTLGRWESDAPVRFAAINGNQFFLADGQHRFTSVVDSGITLKDQIVIRKRFNTRDEFNLWYSRLDVGRKRVARESLLAWGKYDDAEDMARTNVDQVLSASNWIAADFADYGTSPAIEDQMALVDEWLPYGKIAYSLINNHGSDKFVNVEIKKAANMSVFIATIRYSKEKAILFWEKTLSDDGMSTKDPRRLLHKLLRDNQINSRFNKGDRHTKMKMSRYCAAAWNHYWNGTRPKFLMVRKPLDPIRMEGTPYNGK